MSNDSIVVQFPSQYDSTDPNAVSASDPAKYPFGSYLHEMDTDAFFAMREWLTKAVEAAGAKKDGGGIGMGQADIDVELDGCRYNIAIRPLPKRAKS